MTTDSRCLGVRRGAEVDLGYMRDTRQVQLEAVLTYANILHASRYSVASRNFLT